MRYALILFVLFQSSNSVADVHVKLTDKNFITSKNISVSKVGIKLNMKIFYDKATWNRSSYSEGFVKSVAIATIFHLNNFMIDKNLKRINCGQKPQRLDIYVLSRETLNDRERFSIRLLENKNVAAKTILIGYYDPTHYDFNSDAIIVTNISKNRNNRLLAHEISHYFYSRFCIKTQTLQNTEPFALDFEDYYSKKSGLDL